LSGFWGVITPFKRVFTPGIPSLLACGPSSSLLSYWGSSVFILFSPIGKFMWFQSLSFSYSEGSCCKIMWEFGSDSRSESSFPRIIFDQAPIKWICCLSHPHSIHAESVTHLLEPSLSFSKRHIWFLSTTWFCLMFLLDRLAVINRNPICIIGTFVMLSLYVSSLLTHSSFRLRRLTIYHI
jgi:hypothetical protein